MKRTSLSALLICFALWTNAAGIHAPFKALNISDGLSNNYVMDIETDSRGMIWIATESGLNVFDGYSFRIFNSFNSDLEFNSISSLCYDAKKDRLWIAAKMGGLAYLDCANMEFVNVDDFGYENHISNICLSSSGVWISSRETGVFHYSNDNGLFSSLNDMGFDIGKESISYFYDDLHGNLYLERGKNNVDRVDFSKKTVSHISSPDNKRIPGERTYEIMSDHFGNIWIGTDSGLSCYHPSTDRFIHFRHLDHDVNSLISNHIYDIEETSDGTLWISGDIGGISVLNLSKIAFDGLHSASFQNINTCNTHYNLSSNNIRKTKQDRFGNIWIANYGSGVNVCTHEESAFDVLPYYDENVADRRYRQTLGLSFSRKGRLWVGSEDEVAVFQGDSIVRKIDLRPMIGSRHTQAFCVHEISDGEFLFGLYDFGLVHYDETTGKLRQIPLRKPNSDVTCIYESESGDVFIASEWGVYSYRDGIASYADKINETIGETTPYGIVVDKNGRIWVGTYSNGLFVFDKDSTFLHKFDKPSGFIGNEINDILIDRRDRVWVGTRYGLVCFDDPDAYSYTIYGHENGLDDPFIRAIIEGRDGDIYVSTNNTIAKLNLARGVFNKYDIKIGVSMGNFIEGSAVAGRDGKLFFGSLEGVTRVSTNMLNTNSKLPEVILTSIENIDESDFTAVKMDYSNPSVIKLPHSRNSISFNFSVMDYSQVDNVEYSYQCDAVSPKWINLDSEHSVVLWNLRSGKHHFSVRARLKSQDWGTENIKRVDFVIRAPLFLRWYSILFYLVAIVSAILFLSKIYQERLQLEHEAEAEKQKNRDIQELNEEKLRFYTNITHELKTPLTLICGPLDDIVDDKNLPESSRNAIKLVKANATRLSDLVQQLLEFRKTETKNRRLVVTRRSINDFVREVFMSFKELNRKNGIVLSIDIPENDIEMEFDENVITIVLNNLLGNALKNTVQGTVKLTLREANRGGIDYVDMNVSDTGTGISSTDLPHIFERYYRADTPLKTTGTGIGLALVKSLTDLHEGEIKAESVLGEGSSFTFSLIRDNTYPNAFHKDNQSAEGEKTSPETVLPGPSKEGTEKPVLLVVEDNADILEFISSSLKGVFHVIKAKDGRRGLETAFESIPDIIVSDVMMPVMDGMEFCRRVKDDSRTSHIPVILLTAKDTPEDRQEGYDTGADSYLTKPFSIKLLRSRIENLLESRRELARMIADSRHPDMFNYATGGTPRSGKSELNSRDREFLESFFSLIDENIGMDGLDMNFLQDSLGMSHATLYRKLMALTGISANKWIRKRRLEHSVKMMLEDGANVSEAAYGSGFNDINYYRSCFKEEFGVTPSEYLKRNQGVGE